MVPPGIAEMGARDHRRDQWKVHTQGLRRLRRGTMGCTHFIARTTVAEVGAEGKSASGCRSYALSRSTSAVAASDASAAAGSSERFFP